MTLSAAVTDAPARRWLAAGALIAGGALAVGASFLPLGQAVYPASFGQDAGTIISFPVNDLIYWLADMARSPARFSLSTVIWAFFVWGAPALLVALGLALAMARRWRPRQRVMVAGVALVALGAGYAALMCWAYLHPFFGSNGATRSLLSGPVVSFLGYALALAGALLLPSASRAAC